MCPEKELKEKLTLIKPILENALKTVMNGQVLIGKQRISQFEAESMLREINNFLQKPQGKEYKLYPALIPQKLVNSNKQFREIYSLLKL